MKFDGIVGVDNVIGICRQGQTLPVYVRAGNGAIYLAKYASKRSTLSHRELCVELFANMLGQSFELHVATPAILHLSNAAIDQLESLLEAEVQSPYAIGLRYTAISPFLVPSDITKLALKKKLDIASLDIVLSNGDRVPENPNVAWAGNKLLVFDHEHCLEFPRDDDKERFSIHQDLVPVMLESHLFRELPTEDFYLTCRLHLKSIGFNELKKVVPSLPESWQAPFAREVEYVDFISSRVHAFMYAI